MFKINLIPEVKQQQIKLKKINTTVTTVTVIVAIVMGIIIFGLLFYNIGRKAQLSLVNNDIEKINTQLEPYKDLEATVMNLETGLKEIKQILTGGPKWTKFFDELEKVTPADVQITNFDIKGNAVSIDATGAKVQSIDRFIRSFSSYKVDDKTLFSDVAVTGYTVKDGKVTFQAKMNLVGGVLW
jgi:Tfp pilus assembly protein PilN